MTDPFDYDAFEHRSLSIVIDSKNKTFSQLSREIDLLKREYEGIEDQAARQFIIRNLDRRLLMFAIDTAQPRDHVDLLYARNVQQGFNDPHAQVASGIEYADYCREQGRYVQALAVMEKLRTSIEDNQDIDNDQRRAFLNTIDDMARVIKTER